MRQPLDHPPIAGFVVDTLCERHVEHRTRRSVQSRPRKLRVAYDADDAEHARILGPLDAEGRSSSGANTRPLNAPTPSVEKYVPVTYSANRVLAASAVPCLRTLNGLPPQSNAVMSSNSGAAAFNRP